MKALGPQRLRVLFYYLLSVLLMVASLLERHAGMGVWLPCALAASLFSLLGLRGRYNLTSDSN
jgi:hypothetical protein